MCWCSFRSVLIRKLVGVSKLIWLYNIFLLIKDSNDNHKKDTLHFTLYRCQYQFYKFAVKRIFCNRFLCFNLPSSLLGGCKVTFWNMYSKTGIIDNAWSKEHEEWRNGLQEIKIFQQNILCCEMTSFSRSPAAAAVKLMYECLVVI